MSEDLEKGKVVNKNELERRRAEKVKSDALPSIIWNPNRSASESTKPKADPGTGLKSEGITDKPTPGETARNIKERYKNPTLLLKDFIDFKLPSIDPKLLDFAQKRELQENIKAELAGYRVTLPYTKPTFLRSQLVAYAGFANSSHRGPFSPTLMLAVAEAYEKQMGIKRR